MRRHVRTGTEVRIISAKEDKTGELVVEADHKARGCDGVASCDEGEMEKKQKLEGAKEEKSVSKKRKKREKKGNLEQREL